MTQNKKTASLLTLAAVFLVAGASYFHVIHRLSSPAASPHEALRDQAAALMKAGADLRSAAQRVEKNGTPAANIRLHPDASTSGACADTDATCLFASAGGGLSEAAFLASIPAGIYAPGGGGVLLLQPNEATMGAGQPAVRLQGIGTAAADGVLDVFGISEDLCKTINASLGIAGIPVQDAHYADHAPDIVFTAAPGQPAACINAAIITSSPAPVYVFYYAITEN